VITSFQFQPGGRLTSPDNSHTRGLATTRVLLLEGAFVCTLGNTETRALGPQIVHSGSSSIVNTTPVHTAWRAAANRIRIRNTTAATPAAINVDLTAHSSQICSTSFPSFAMLADNLLQPADLTLTQNLRLHHPAHQFLHRSLTEAVDDLPHRARRQAPRRFHCPIQICPALCRMPQISLLLEASQQGASRRLFQLPIPRNLLMHRIHRTRAPRIPDHPHHLVLQLCQHSPDASAGSTTRCHGTTCTTNEITCQALGAQPIH
jgi:hypothetical protein